MGKIASYTTLILIVILAVLLGAWNDLDRGGWIPHHTVVDTYVGQNGWTPGEYRECIGVPTREGKLSPNRGVFGGFLSCDLEGHALEDIRQIAPHALDVTFWGRVERHDMGDNDDHRRELRRRNAICAEDPKTDQERIARRGLCDEEKHIGKIEWLWRCRRNASSITCWADN